jgi:phosphoribosylformylglycinamidine (FGAM) synthase-like enzyme
MAELYSSGGLISSIASQTLKNVRHRYEALFRDPVVTNIFIFMVAFSSACRFQNTRTQLQKAGISLPEQPTLLSIVKGLRDCVPFHEANSEYGQLALAAAADAIGQWHKQHATKQIPLFEASLDFFDSWRSLGRGSGFCELSRLFFGKLTERYLNYFLDRAASVKFQSIQQRDQFQREIHNHIDEISKHAFETAKITQSFAAGWYERHTREGLPELKEVEGFLAIAFGKLRDELRREEEAK